MFLLLHFITTLQHVNKLSLITFFNLRSRFYKIQQQNVQVPFYISITLFYRVDFEEHTHVQFGWNPGSITGNSGQGMKHVSSLFSLFFLIAKYCFRLNLELLHNVVSKTYSSWRPTLDDRKNNLVSVDVNNPNTYRTNQRNT